MNGLKNAAIATGLATGLFVAGGCGESAIEQEAQINGFGHGIDVQVIEPQWIPYYDQGYLPGSTLRNISSYEEVVDCRAVSDGWGWNTNDSECYGDLCMFTASDDQHCEAVWELRYSYEQLEDTVVRQCIAPIVKREFKGNAIEDTSCENELRENQRLQKSGRYVLWVSTPNPKEEGPETLSGRVEVTAEQWADASSSEPITVSISDGEITEAVS